MHLMRVTVCSIALAVTLLPAAAAAQTLGSFTWQQQPYCNRLTFTVTVTGQVFTLDGFDDGCGAAERLPASGVATINPNGSVSLGISIVSSGGAAHIDATINPATLSGTWGNDFAAWRLVRARWHGAWRHARVAARLQQASSLLRHRLRWPTFRRPSGYDGTIDGADRDAARRLPREFRSRRPHRPVVRLADGRDQRGGRRELDANDAGHPDALHDAPRSAATSRPPGWSIEANGFVGIGIGEAASG